MTRALALALVAAIGLGSPAPAWAYLKFGVEIDSTTREVRWSSPVRYFVTERGVDGVSQSDFRDAIGRAFATWQAVPGMTARAELLGSTEASPNGLDGRTTLGFLDRPELDRVLGATSLMLDATTGAIVEADVFFNTRFPWSVAPAGQAGRVDLESVALHEIGHLFGLGHSAIGETELENGGGRRVLASGAVMFPIAMTAGSIADRVLQPDDVAGISDLYGSDGNTGAEGTSSISGRVTRNGVPVFGAHVVAFNLATGTLIGGFSLGDNGQFVIAGLQPGPHLLRVEPLDDADPASFFVGDVDVGFRVTFAPSVVVAPHEGSSEPVTIEVTPR